MLLATKLFAPQQAPHYVERQRLHAKLRATLSCRIALVSAPAGFGKSTLLAGWIDSLRRESEGFGVAWLSLDEQDNNPNRFYTHLITAVHQANPTVGGDLLALLRLPQAPSGENLLGGLINDLSQRSAPLILILDDYHAIENRDLHKALVYLIEHSPPHLHVVIATRANPPFPLARWRLSGALLEIREQDLRFDSREIVEFLAQSVDLHLTSSDIAAVEQRTEGWVGALQLAAISLQDTGDPPSFLRKLSGSHAYIVDYLVEEVLSRQPPHIQQFLLHTSYLDRFCGDLCAAVTDEGDSEAILQHLYQQNLFTIALDDEHHWFRYHHLFRDMLRFRLRRSDPNAGAALQRAASRWCEENELLAEAVYYALSASDMARAAALIEDHYWSMLERSDFAQLADWLQSLPPDLIRAQPRLGLAQAWSLYATYNIPAIQACLDGVERAVEAADAAQLRSDPRFCAELLTLRASNAMYAGDSERAIVLAEKHWPPTFITTRLSSAPTPYRLATPGT
jgi:LuxR family maltose regulon positive regulatory protein